MSIKKISTTLYFLVFFCMSIVAIDNGVIKDYYERQLLGKTYWGNGNHHLLKSALKISDKESSDGLQQFNNTIMDLVGYVDYRTIFSAIEDGAVVNAEMLEKVDMDIYLKAALSAFKQSKHNVAISMLQPLVLYAPMTKDVVFYYYFLACEQLQARVEDAAVYTLQEIMELGNNDPNVKTDSWFKSGVAMLDSIYTAHGMTAERNALKVGSFNYLPGLAQYHEELGHIERAIEYYQLAAQKAMSADERVEYLSKIVELWTWEGDCKKANAAISDIHTLGHLSDNATFALQSAIAFAMLQQCDFSKVNQCVTRLKTLSAGLPYKQKVKYYNLNSLYNYMTGDWLTAYNDAKSATQLCEQHQDTLSVMYIDASMMRSLLDFQYGEIDSACKYGNNVYNYLLSDRLATRHPHTIMWHYYYAYGHLRAGSRTDNYYYGAVDRYVKANFDDSPFVFFLSSYAKDPQSVYAFGTEKEESETVERAKFLSGTNFNPAVADALAFRSISAGNVFYYATEDRFAKRAITLYQKIEKTNHPNKAYAYIGLAEASESDGFFKEAIDTLMSAKRLLEAQGLNKSFAYYLVNDRLGRLHTELGNYSHAEQALQTAVEVATNLYGKGDKAPTVASIDLGELYFFAGDYEQADSILRPIFKTRTAYSYNSNKVWHRSHDKLLSTFLQLCVMTEDKSIDAVTKLESYRLNFVKDMNKHQGVYYLTSWLDYAQSMLLQNRFDDAAVALNKFAKDSKELTDKGFCIKSSMQQRYIMLYGQYLEGKAQFKEIDQLYTDAISKAQSRYGNSHPQIPIYYNQLAINSWKQGHTDKATDYFHKSFNSYRERIRQSFLYMSEEQRQYLISSLEQPLKDLLPSFCVQNPTDVNAQFLYDMALFEKGLLLSASTNLQRAIITENNPALESKYNELCKTQNELIYYEAAGEVTDKQQIDQLCTRKQELERYLAANSNAFARLIKQTITCEQIRTNLKDGDVAIEIIAIGRYNRKTSQYSKQKDYYALVLKAGNEKPSIIKLFEEQQIAPFMASDLSDLYDYSDVGKKVTQLVLNPLMPKLKDAKRVYFSTDGLLNLINIEALPLNKEKTFADQYQTYRLSSTRRLAEKDISESNTNMHTATLYGGLLYDVDSAQLIKQHTVFQHALASDIVYRHTETDRAGDIYLPGTKVEVEEISSKLKNGKYSVNLFTAETGTEESFKSLSGHSDHILHIATHGFFSPKSNFIDPLCQSGLRMSGSNWCKRGNTLPLGVDDGTLTAREITMLNLSNCRLAVLSACETGLGHVTADGVYGLQRAFKQAGVHSLVMSLWKVEDKATSMMMSIFYDYLLQGYDRHVAFHNAQNKVRELYPDPHSWASFYIVD